MKQGEFFFSFLLWCVVYNEKEIVQNIIINHKLKVIQMMELIPVNHALFLIRGPQLISRASWHQKEKKIISHIYDDELFLILMLIRRQRWLPTTDGQREHINDN